MQLLLEVWYHSEMNDRGDQNRLIALGASNMTRAFHVIAAGARNEWGDGVEIFTAHGLGRSFGAASTVHLRTLPGILECGLWKGLERMPAAATRAVISDVGNDILFGYAAEQIIGWVEECVRRIRRFTGDITIATLPMENIRGMSARRFVFFRSILFPRSRVGFEESMATAEQVERGLEQLIAAHGIRQIRPRREWYSYDPIHIRPGRWSSAWGEILGIEGEIEWRWGDAIRMYLMKPEQRWIVWKEQFKEQTGTEMKQGGRVWLY